MVHARLWIPCLAVCGSALLIRQVCHSPLSAEWPGQMDAFILCPLTLVHTLHKDSAARISCCWCQLQLEVSHPFSPTIDFSSIRAFAELTVSYVGISPSFGHSSCP